MRNLLGRLHTRSPEELARIATFWQVPLRSGDRATQVGRLYRELTDARSVRTTWDRLSEDERRCVRLLALGDEEAMPLADMANRLDLPEAATRQLAIHLYHVGILARQGDDQPLPVGEAPRLFLPRELALLFRRVQDEIEAGDLSTTPLRALLELLDDAEIEEAGRIWGLTVIPGLRQRVDLTAQLLRQVANPGSLPIVVARLRGDAAKIWQRLRDEPDHSPVPLATAAAAAGLANDDARSAQRLRDALSELESSLLGWPTYRHDGSRWLFIPIDIRAPRTADAATPAMPEPVPAPPVETIPWHPEAAIAWDLLTAIRALTRIEAPAWRAAQHLPRPWLRQLNPDLWGRGNELPRPGYLDLLVTLAEHLGLVRRPADAEAAPLQIGPAMRAWRTLSFAEQIEHLRRQWQQSLDWTENRATNEIEIWGADWRGFRHRLLGLIAELPAGDWFPLGDLAAWLAHQAPDLLGDTFTVATAQPLTQDRAATDGERRRAALAQLIGTALTTSLAWLGIVDVWQQDRKVAIVRRAAPPSPVLATSDRPALAVLPSMTIELQAPTPLRVWSLSAFANLTRLDRVSDYELTQHSVQRALHAGFDLTQITTFLTRQSGSPLSPEVVTRLEGWTNELQRIRLRRALIVTPDDPATAERLRSIVGAAGGQTHLLATGDLVIDLPAAGIRSNPEEEIATLLRAHGFTTQWNSDHQQPGGRSRPGTM